MRCSVKNTMRRSTFITSACLTLLATMALARTVPDDYDRAANFSRYKTYAWTRGTALTDEPNHTRVVHAIEAGLLAKGLVRVPPNANPDALVAYHVSFDLEQFARSVLVGTLVVEISDPRTDTILWRSQATGDLRPDETPEGRGRRIAKAVEKMFKNYPPKP
jgi:hypothetical protein